MIAKTLWLFAQATPDTDPEAIRKTLQSRPTSGHSEIVIILSCALALSLVLFIWAFFIRKRPRSARGSLVVERRRKGSPDEAEDASKRRRRKRRPDHPDNWGRNPTLGETGGLPPTRPDSDMVESSSDGESDGPSENGPQAARPR